MEREEDNVCGRLTESKHVEFASMYDTSVGAECQSQLSEKGLSVICDLPGLRSNVVSIPHTIPCGFGQRRCWASAEARLHCEWKCMERDGHPRLQLLALVDPHRWDYIREGTNLFKDMDRLTAFYKGLSTWARWVDLNVDPSRTKVFFQGISPTHYQGKEWNQPKKNCYGELEPLSGSIYPAGAPPAASVVNRVLSTIKKPVYLLDITTLSQLRKDAHPSAYSGERGGNDCSHWCLPGLPDTWNQLLYAALIM